MTPNDPARSAEEIERELLEEVEKTRGQYEAAKRQWEQLDAVHTDLGSTLDGLHALRTANELKRHAASTYSRALSRFCEFINRRNIPTYPLTDD